MGDGECRLERFVRQDDENWLYSEVTDMNRSLELTSIVCRLPLAKVYRMIDFERAKANQQHRPKH